MRFVVDSTRVRCALCVLCVQSCANVCCECSLRILPNVWVFCLRIHFYKMEVECVSHAATHIQKKGKQLQNQNTNTKKKRIKKNTHTYAHKKNEKH